MIDRDAAIAAALAIIDRDGVEAFSIRNLGNELGFNGASLYHHFKDKEEILEGVRVLILREARVILRGSARATWQDYARTSCTRYRTALLAHPNVAPLMSPGLIRPSASVIARERLVEKMVEAGVPMRLAYPIMDSVEMLAFGSAVLNPHRLRPDERFSLRAEHNAPNLGQAIKPHRSADKLFKIELDALLEGWASTIARETATRKKR